MASNGSERPRIGITTYAEPARWGVWDRPAALLPHGYVDTVWRAGGVPLLLPPLPGGAEAAVAGVHAVVLAGGADVDPARYAARPGPHTVETRPDRDAWELAVLDAALAAGRPVLGVCRGTQLLNVARGGTLHQHLPDVVGTHDHRPAPATYATLRVRVQPGSRLYDVLGPHAAVPCYHHQALDRLGRGLRPVAWAEDGIVEAVEGDPEDGFLVGVQWHPEQDADDLRLFTALVEAAAAAAGKEHR